MVYGFDLGTQKIFCEL